MNIMKFDNIVIAEVDKATHIQSPQDMLDIMATVRYNEKCDNIGIVLYKESLEKVFFDLKTGLAGEMLQKFSNYCVKLAIIGDFSNEKSKSLNDFIRECNRGNLVFFVNNIEKAVNMMRKR